MLRDVEPGGDLVGAEMLVEQQQHLHFAGRELLRDLVRDATDAASLAHAIEQPARDRPGQGRLAPCHAAQERRNPLRGLALQQVARRTRSDRLEQILLRA